MSTSTHLITAEELIKLPRGQHRYELIKGELLTMSPTGGEHGAVTANVTGLVISHVKANELGRVFGAETGFRLEVNPDTVLAADLSFVSKERLSLIPRGYLEIAPDLAIEVVSPSDRRKKIYEKVERWLAFGVRSVWLVWSQNRTVELCTPDGPNRVLTDRDLLFDDVLPGFRISVASIFE